MARLVLTYDNSKVKDGMGAQLQRIYGVYALCRQFGVAYLHSPIAAIHRINLGSLTPESVSDLELGKINSRFRLPSDVQLSGEEEVIEAFGLDSDGLHAAMHRARTSSVDIVLRTVLPFSILDKAPRIYEHLKTLPGWERIGSDSVQVAIHVRRGDIVHAAPDRLLRNDYFYDVAKTIASVLAGCGKKFKISIFTEFCESDGDPIRKELFGVENVEVHANTPAIDPVIQMALADIVVLSHSSYSYFAALLNRKGIVIYHPFWHAPLPGWVVATGERDVLDASLRPPLRAALGVA